MPAIANLDNWTPPPRPDGAVMCGQYCQLERLDADTHAALLFRAFDGHDALWDYMAVGPFASASLYHRWAREAAVEQDPFFYVVKALETGEYLGVASFMRIEPAHGVIEVGNIIFAPAMQRTPIATEVQYLMMKWAFAAGYRRYEWKCNADNMPSRRAAQRLGFSFEGVFRQHMIVKGRNRDTAWFSVIDSEWPALDEAFQMWLSSRNFDGTGQQHERLSDLTRLVRGANDPALKG